MSYAIANKEFTTKQEAEEFYLMVAEEILRNAIEMTPYVTGKLRNSFCIVRYGTEPNNIAIVNNCEYAKFVHELIFNKHINGQSKFLEDAAWEVGNAYNVETYIDIGTLSITCYLDFDKKGYNVNRHRRNAEVLFKRYHDWRVENRKDRRERLINRIEELEKGINKNSNDEDDLIMSLLNLDDIRAIKEAIKRLDTRDEYEKSAYPIFYEAFKMWTKTAGGVTGNIADNEMFVVPLSKYYGVTKYSNEIIQASKELEQELLKQQSEIESENQLSENISLFDENTIDNIEQMSFYRADRLNSDIEQMLKLKTNLNIETDIYNISNHRFKNGFMKNPLNGRLKIKVIDKWEGVE